MLFLICLMIMFFLILPLMIIIINNIISKKFKLNFEKMSPFECGFLPFYFFKMPISMNFFLISILFIIFDIEIAFMFPMISSINFSNLMNWWISIFMFLLIILLGLMYEWSQSMLNWK